MFNNGAALATCKKNYENAVLMKSEAASSGV
jgi:hypothetical protein